jgi:elongation factor P
MQIVATQIREGMILVLDGDLFRVTKAMHRTPGKGNACMQTKLKNIISGKNLEKRFLSSERTEKADLETREMQYLFKDSDGFVFMDNETYDQNHLPDDLLGEGSQFLEEGVTYGVTYHEGNPVGIELPKTINIKVTVAPPDIKKATANSHLKNITLENGLEIQAPGFIKEGDTIKINTETLEYLERVT